MRTIPTSKARQIFSEITGQVEYAKKRVILTKHGRPVAALIPFEELQRLDAEARPSVDNDRFSF